MEIKPVKQSQQLEPELAENWTWVDSSLYHKKSSQLIPMNALQSNFSTVPVDLLAVPDM